MTAPTPTACTRGIGGRTGTPDPPGAHRRPPDDAEVCVPIDRVVGGLGISTHH